MPAILQKHNTQIEFWKLLPRTTHTNQAYGGISVSQETVWFVKVTSLFYEDRTYLVKTVLSMTDGGI